MDVDFAKGAASITMSIASLYGGSIELRADKIDGTLLGTVQVKTAGEGDIWRTTTTPVKNIKGIHDLYFVFKGENDLMNVDWWMFQAN